MWSIEPTFRRIVSPPAVLQLPAHAGSSLSDFSTLKMEAIRSSETSVQSTTSTRRHTPEYGILHKNMFATGRERDSSGQRNYI
jgi:hypothetical protein